MLAPEPVKIRCRQIAASDLGAVAALLKEGFPRRTLKHWQTGLDGMAARPAPANTPQFGYCLESGGQLVGVILMICSERLVDGEMAVFINLASWYVKPEYRAYAHQLAAMALKYRNATYTNVTAAPSTWGVVEQQGYTKYCNGLFFALAALARPAPGVKIHQFAAICDRTDVRALSDFELLQRHSNWGCTVLLAEEAGKLKGFIFRRFAMRSGLIKLPAMFVVQAPSQNEMIRLAGNFGRHLSRLAAPILIMDANAPVAGLEGAYTEKRGRKFFKGPHQPALCALADSEYAIFEI